MVVVVVLKLMNILVFLIVLTNQYNPSISSSVLQIPQLLRESTVLFPEQRQPFLCTRIHAGEYCYCFCSHGLYLYTYKVCMY